MGGGLVKETTIFLFVRMFSDRHTSFFQVGGGVVKKIPVILSVQMLSG